MMTHTFRDCWLMINRVGLLDDANCNAQTACILTFRYKTSVRSISICHQEQMNATFVARGCVQSIHTDPPSGQVVATVVATTDEF